MKNKCLLLLIISWLTIRVHSVVVSLMLSDMYSKLDPNAPYEEKKKFYPIASVQESNRCPEGQFKDVIVAVYPWRFYCFEIPKFPDLKNRPRVIATDEKSRLMPCEESSDCFFHLKDARFACDTIGGYKYKHYLYSYQDGLCIKSEAVAYVYTEIYYNLPANTPIEEKKKYLPVSYSKEKECYRKEICEEGQFCGGVDTFPEEFESTSIMMCYYKPKLPDSNSEGPIIIKMSEKEEYILSLHTCNQNIDCSCIWENCAHKYLKCFLKTGLKLVGGGDNERVIYNGLCIKTNPIALVFSDIYLNLDDDVLYEDRRKYFPVDYVDLKHETVPKICSNNKECATGQFCGVAYDYVVDSAKREDSYPKSPVLYCFTIPHFADSNNSQRIIPIVPDKAEMEICDSTLRCKADEFWRCDMDTGFKFAMEDADNKRKLYDGICVKEHPVAYVLSEQYKTLDKDTPFDQRKKYFPVDYEGFSQNTSLKTCSINSDCADGEFCGASFDSTDNTPKENSSYCFAIPQLPELNDGPKVVVKPANNNLALCNKNLGCASDELWKCDFESGLKFAGEVGGKREIFNGVCIKAPPVALVFSDTYLNLNSDVSYEGKRKFFAVDYVEPNQTSSLKTCSTNKDCDGGQFCDQILDFTNNLAKKGRSHCFAVPTIDAPFHESTKITIQSDLSGLMLCNDPSNCGSELFCNVQTGQKYVKSKEGVKENVDFNGICMKAEICKVNEHNEQFKWSFGTSPTTTKISCDSDVDCAGTRDTQDTIFQSSCVLNKAFHNVNLCCHRETQPCKIGKLVGPEVRCGKNELFKDGIFAECNGGLEKMGIQGEKADKWCDEGNNQCCQNPTDDKIQYCSDGQTPLFNEPKCQNYDENIPNSGKCVYKAGSICKNGHCCPDVKIDAQGKLVRNKYSYTTNHPCIPGIRPSQFPAGYCEPELGKVVIFGELSPLNETLTRWPEDAPKKCQKDSDCSTDNSTLCIYNEEPYCYYNPMRHVPTKSSNLVIIIVIIIGIIIILIAVIAGVTVWMLKKKKKIIMKPAGSLESQSAQTPSKSMESKVTAESVSGMKTPTAKSVN